MVRRGWRLVERLRGASRGGLSTDALLELTRGDRIDLSRQADLLDPIDGAFGAAQQGLEQARGGRTVRPRAPERRPLRSAARGPR